MGLTQTHASPGWGMRRSARRLAGVELLRVGLSGSGRGVVRRIRARPVGGVERGVVLWEALAFGSWSRS